MNKTVNVLKISHIR